MSLRTFARLGSSLSVFDVSHLGATLSLRGFGRLGSSLALIGLARLGSSLSLFGFGQLGSSLSLRSMARLGATLAVLDMTHLGSSLSLRSCSRLASTLSVFGYSRFGASLSLLDFINLGSSLKLRAFTRLGSAMSVLDFTHLGSSMAVRGIWKNAGQGRALSCYGALGLGSFRTYIQSEFNTTEDQYTQVKAYALGTGDNETDTEDGTEDGKPLMQEGSGAVISWNADGGTLHGTWSADGEISTSDRRLKENIRPLQQTLRDGQSTKILRELRPVSYTYTGTSKESKNTRFGFIADEMQRSLPQITRALPHADEGRQGLVYQDLLAFLTAMLQNLAGEMSTLVPRLASIEARIAQRKKWKKARRAKVPPVVMSGSTGAMV